MRPLQLLILANLLAISPLASAISFEFAPDRSELVPTVWTQREVSTRGILGCRQWDILQGTGWFPATFYTEYSPSLSNGIYRVEHKQKWPAKLCAAKMDAYNTVRLEMRSDLVEEGLLRGFFHINPNGISNETTINCRFNPASTSDTLSCDEAQVLVPKEGSVRIHIHLED